MKKSFMGVMLALAALVMMLGASSAFAYDSSADVSVTLTSNDIASISGDATIKFKDAYGVLVSADGSTNGVSVDVISAAVVSTGTQVTQTVVVYVKSSKGSLGLTDVKFGSKPALVTEPLVYDIITDASFKFTGVSTAHSGSLDVGATSKDAYALVFYSGDKASDDTYVVELIISGDLAEVEPTAEALNTATITPYIDGVAQTTKYTVTSKDATAKELSVTSGAKVSFSITADPAGSLKTVSTDTKTLTSNDSYLVTVSADTPVTFSFASSDISKDIKFVLTLKVSSTVDSTADYGSFTLTPAGATDSTALSITSSDYKGKLVASADYTATALSKSGSYSATSPDLFTLTFAATAGTDGEITIAEVYDEEMTAVSDDVLAGKVITPLVVGDYKILFKATPKADATASAAEAQYFTVNFSLAKSSDGTDDDDDTATYDEYYNSAEGAISVSDLDGTTKKALEDAYGYDLDNLPTDSSGRPEVFLVQLPAEPKVDNVIRVKFIPSSSSGTLDFTADNIIWTYFKAKLAHRVIVVDCTELYASNTAAGSKKNFDAGWYGVVARDYTANGASVSAFSTADSTIDASLDPAEYAGNPSNSSSRGSSGGCDAGFGALALIALALPLVKKFSK